jgi:hypothetical protein
MDTIATMERDAPDTSDRRAQRYAWPLELTDLAGMPRSLHRTVYEILARGHQMLTGYHRWVVDRAMEAASRSGCDTIVEAGAGAAP